MDTPTPEPIAIDTLAAKAGTVVGTSRWRVIDQAMIDAFADLICDHQYIHVDPERAKETPYGTTVAHGFLSLSILGGLAGEVMPRIAGSVMGVNYGFDRVRFVAPVRSGRKVRAILTLKELEQTDSTVVSLLFEVILEVDDEEKPAVAAIWRVRSYLSGPAA
jgi:acyl dehydratase